MTTCERSLEVEDLVLGRTHDGELWAHLATCASCTHAKALFEEERALFAARPMLPAPPLELSRRPRFTRLQRALPELAAAAAAAAAVAAVAYGQPFEFPAECEPRQTAASALMNEPLLCEGPGATPSPSFATYEKHAPVCGENDRAICDEPDWLTSSSSATP